MKKIVLALFWFISPMGMYFYSGMAFMFGVGLLSAGNPVGLFFLACMVLGLSFAKGGMRRAMQIVHKVGLTDGLTVAIKEIEKAEARHAKDNAPAAE